MAFGDDHIKKPEKTSTRLTKKPVPVLIGPNYKHVMGKATIEQTAAVVSPTTHQVLEPAKVIITIVAEGKHAQELGDFVAAEAVVALSFEGVPVEGHHRKEP